MAAVLKFMWLNPVKSTMFDGGYMPYSDFYSSDNFVFDVGNFWDPGVISSGYYVNYLPVCFYGLIGFSDRDEGFNWYLTYYNTYGDTIEGLRYLELTIGWTIPTGYGPNGAEIRPERSTITRLDYKWDQCEAEGYYWTPAIIHCSTNWGTGGNSTVTFDTTGVPNCPVSSVSMSPLVVNLADRTTPSVTSDNIIKTTTFNNALTRRRSILTMDYEIPFYPAHFIFFAPNIHNTAYWSTEPDSELGSYCGLEYGGCLLRLYFSDLESDVYLSKIWMLATDCYFISTRSFPTIDGVKRMIRNTKMYTVNTSLELSRSSVVSGSGYILYNGTTSPMLIPNSNYMKVLINANMTYGAIQWYFYLEGDTIEDSFYYVTQPYNCVKFYNRDTQTLTSLGILRREIIYGTLGGYVDNTDMLEGSDHTFTTHINAISVYPPTDINVFNPTTDLSNYSFELWNTSTHTTEYNWTTPPRFEYDSIEFIAYGSYGDGWQYVNPRIITSVHNAPVNRYDEWNFTLKHNTAPTADISALFYAEIIIPLVFDDIDDLRNAGYDLYSFNGTPLYEAIDRGEYKIVTGKNIVRLRLVTKVDNKQLFTAFLQLRNKIMKIDVSQYLDRDIILDLDLLKPNLFGDNMYMLYVEFKDPNTGLTSQTLELAFTINFWHYNHLLLKPGEFGPNGLIIDKYLTADNCDEYKLPYIH